MKHVYKTTMTLKPKALVEVLETGEITGIKILSLKFNYKNVVADTGRGNATYKQVVDTITLELNT